MLLVSSILQQNAPAAYAGNRIPIMPALQQRLATYTENLRWLEGYLHPRHNAPKHNGQCLCAGEGLTSRCCPILCARACA